MRADILFGLFMAAVVGLVMFGVRHNRTVRETLARECGTVLPEHYAACRMKVLDREGWKDPTHKSDTNIVYMPTVGR